MLVFSKYIWSFEFVTAQCENLETEFHETFRNCSLHDAILHLFKIPIRMILGFPRAKQGLCHYDILGGGTPALIRISSNTSKQNFWAPIINKTHLHLQNKGGGDPSLNRYSFKTAEQNFTLVSKIWLIKNFKSLEFELSRVTCNSKLAPVHQHSGVVI